MIINNTSKYNILVYPWKDNFDVTLSPNNFTSGLYINDGGRIEFSIYTANGSPTNDLHGVASWYYYYNDYCRATNSSIPATFPYPLFNMTINISNSPSNNMTIHSDNGVTHPGLTPFINSGGLISIIFDDYPAPKDTFKISFKLVNKTTSFQNLFSTVANAPYVSSTILSTPSTIDSGITYTWDLLDSNIDSTAYTTSWKLMALDPTHIIQYTGGGSITYDALSDYGISNIQYNWNNPQPITVTITAVDSYGNTTPSPFTHTSPININDTGNQSSPPFPTTTNGKFNFNKGGIITITYTD